MHKIYELYEYLCGELENFSGRELSEAEIRYADVIAHATKNIGKIIEQKMEMEQQASRGSYNSYDGGMSRRGSFAGGVSNRGRSYAPFSGGASYKRDSMGRFSRAGGASHANKSVDRLAEIYNEEQDEGAREVIMQCIEQLQRG